MTQCILKSILSSCLLFLLHSIPGISQVVADPANGQMDITDKAGVSLNANFIPPAANVTLQIPVYNLNQLVALPAGSCKFIVTLGNNMILDPLFNVATAPLNNYFSWTTANLSGKVQITGNLTSAIPPDFYGIATFKIKATTSLGTSIIESDFLVTNHNTSTPLTDEDAFNNTATLTYTVTMRTLPVTFTALSLTKKGCHIQVNFKAENAINVKQYEVELSKDGIHFIKLGDMPVKNITSYQFDFSLAGINTANNIFIRIKSVDLDGTGVYSVTKQINGYCDENTGGMQLYPNPVGSNWAEVIITATGKKFNGQYNLILMDITGKILNITKFDLLNATQLNFPINYLSSGQYILRVSNKANGQLTTLRFNRL